MPTMNPDGFEYEYKQTQHAQGPGRFNANKVDLNRNFPKVELEHPTNHNDTLIPKQDDITNGGLPLEKLTNSQQNLEPEVRAVMHWSLVYPFVLSGNLHGGALVANYPYDNRMKDSTQAESRSPDDQTFQMLAKAYSHVSHQLKIFARRILFSFFKAHPKMHKGDACLKFNDGITNGAAWYVVDGGMQDWSYAYTSDMEVTIELGCNKYPDQDDLKSYWDDNKGALLAYITQVSKRSFFI
jgi:carboxypeptidase E